MDNVTVVLGLVLSILGVISYIVKLAVDYSRLKSEVKELKSDLVQYKKELENKINDIVKTIEEMKMQIRELYEFRLSTSQVLTELSTTLKMMSDNINNQFKNLQEKLDKLGVEKNG